MPRLVVMLPQEDRSLAPYELGTASPYEPPQGPLKSRVAYAAVHVVADPFAGHPMGAATALDWEATLAYRGYLWSMGLSVAEAMDTAQRGMGLDWSACRELIRRTAVDAKAARGGLACGATTDQLPPRPARLEEIERAYDEQCAFIEEAGATVVLMASRHLAGCARAPEDYMRVYDHVLSQVSRPVILHWLGEVFDPQLAGYWGSRDLDAATHTVVRIIREHAAKVDGIKVSLLDDRREIELRGQLQEHDVRLYTGDDFNYPDLIRGDARGYSHALLGIFDAIAPAASAALQALDRGQLDAYEKILAPTVPLSRHIFGPPTYYYKTGVVFLAYLNGHQQHFRMVGGLESARSIVHLGRILALADQARLLRFPELAASRFRKVLAVAGIE
jgi:hypothetical protein